MSGTIDQSGTGGLDLATAARTSTTRPAPPTTSRPTPASYPATPPASSPTPARSRRPPAPVPRRSPPGSATVAPIIVQTGTISLANNSDGTSTGGTFTVAQGATLDLTGGADVYYDGDLLRNRSRNRRTGQRDARLWRGSTTFNFSAGLFQWTGGDSTSMINDLDLTRGRSTSPIPPRPRAVTLAGGGTLANVGDDRPVRRRQPRPGQRHGHRQPRQCHLRLPGRLRHRSGFCTGFFTNAGTLEKTAGTGTSQISTGFSNSRAIIVETGHHQPGQQQRRHQHRRHLHRRPGRHARPHRRQ